MVANNPQSIKNANWRQGSILPQDLASLILSSNEISDPPKEDFVLIVATHDCDVTNPSYEAEPHVELLIATRAEKREGGYSYGKNPRKIQFPICVEGNNIVYETSIHSRHRVDRSNLESFAPDQNARVPDEDLRYLARWLGKRYDRGSFPDEFNERIEPVRSKLKKALRNDGRYISGLYLSLSSIDELDTDEDYGVVIRAVVPREVYEGQASFDPYKALDRVHKLLDDCEGVRVDKADLVSTAEFSLEDLEQSNVLDFDDLSFRDDKHENPSA